MQRPEIQCITKNNLNKPVYLRFLSLSATAISAVSSKHYGRGRKKPKKHLIIKHLKKKRQKNIK